MTDTDQNEYPLYPDLPESARGEACELLEKFKRKISKAAEQTISDFYCDILPFIETDAWTNFRNTLLAGLCDYNNRHNAQHDFQKIRQAIYKEYRDEIIVDLNQDLVKENERLKQCVEDLQKYSGRG